MGTTLQVRHTVENFDAWKDGFDEHEKARREHGASGHQLLHDGNKVTVLISFADRDAAEGFATDPALREAMVKSGVVGAPELTYLEPVEEISY